MLDLDFSPEQTLLAETVRDVLTRHCPLSVVREMEDDPIGYPPALWTQLADLDLVGILLPEAFGGSGMSLVEGVALYEEFGRALAPIPHLVSAVLAGGVLARAGSDAQRDAWLPRITSGDAVCTVAWLEPESGYGPLGVQLQAVPDGQGYRLSGQKRHVTFARAAQAMIVLARIGDTPTDVELFLVETAADGVSMEQRFSIGSDSQYDVHFNGAVAERIGEKGRGWAVWQDTLADAHVLLAAQAIGGARYALEITVQYAKDREQFDKPLGAFQALAHYLADASTAVDGGTQLVHEAAWARANGKPSDVLVPAAKLFATTTFRDVTAMAQQVFGGIGFTVEFDIQLYFRRAKLLQLSVSDTRALEESVASAVLD